MSFKDVVWNPERLNVLIGPNGSGKSNLLRALELIRASAAGSLRDFVLSKGGLPRLLWGGSAQEVVFRIGSGITPSQPPAVQDAYSLSLVQMPQSASFRVKAESLKLSDQSAPVFLREGDALTVEQGAAKRLPDAETYLSLLSALWTDPVPYMFQQRLRAWAIYQGLQVDEDEIGRAHV